MIGHKRLDALHHCIEEVVRLKIPGDFIECGVGAVAPRSSCAGVLKAYGEGQRRVWVADSFKGLPAPSAATFPRTGAIGISRFGGLPSVLRTCRRTSRVMVCSMTACNFCPAGSKILSLVLPSNNLRSCVPMETCTNRRSRYSKTCIPGWPWEATASSTIMAPRKPAARLPMTTAAAAELSAPLQAIDWSGVHWRKEA